MEYYNDTLAVEVGWLISSGVMSRSAYDKMAQRGDLQVLRRGCRGKGALVAFDSMPRRYKEAVVTLLGDVRERTRYNVLEAVLEHSSEAKVWFEGYKIDTDRRLPLDRRMEYYANAMVLDAIGRVIANSASKRKAMGGRVARFWDEICDAVVRLDMTEWPHSLPENARALERKYQRYKAEGYVSLVHKTYQSGIKNAAKVADENQQAILVTLMSDPRNLDNAQVASLYNAMADEMGWKHISAATVAVWRNKCDDLVYARRRGGEQYRAKREMQVKRVAASNALSFWTMDGWDVELLYQHKPERGATTYHNRLTMVVVLDCCAGVKYPIGVAVGRNESPALIREALRDAERETQRLFGDMYRVRQLQTDHFAMKNLKPTYQIVAEKVVPARVKNAKAKPIEAWFNYFNKKYCQLQPNWSGFGTTSRKELQPNMELLSKNKRNYPDFDGVVAQIVGFIQAERAALETEYVAQFEAEGLKALDMTQYLMTFGESTGDRRYLLQGGGIRCTIGGQKMDYDCFDTHFRKYPSTRWQLRYDPEDLHYAVAVNDDESLQFILEEKYVQPLALADRKDGDAVALKRVMDFNRRKEQELQEELTPMLERSRELLENTTLSKILITDSRGQHKLVKAKARLQASLPVEDDNNNNNEENIYDMY